MTHRLELIVLPGRFAACRLPVDDPIPQWASGPTFTSITRTTDELSIVCDERRVPGAVSAERGYAALRVAGVLEPTAVGILVAIATPLAVARVSILAIGTHDTDYVLVHHTNLARAIAALRAAGHSVVGD